MAVKNHALDQKIVEAAQAEFLEKGYRDASLHQIADRAGLTTGALYTRYRNKDDLFCSLVREFLDEVQAHSGEVEQLYEKAREERDPALFLAAIRLEEQNYRLLLLSHRKACVLFFCRSGGSSLEKQLSAMMEQKAAATADYLRSISRGNLDLDGVGLLMSGQFAFFRQLLERNYSPEKMLKCLETVELYMDAGWQAIFEAIL